MICSYFFTLYRSFLTVAENLLNWLVAIPETPFGFAIYTSIFGGIITSGIIFFLEVYFFKVPKLELHLDYRIGNPECHTPVLDFSVYNCKKWIGLPSGQVYFDLFIPAQYAKNRVFSLITINGQKKWEDLNIDTKDIFMIDNSEYYLFRGAILMSINPRSKVHFLRIGGKIDTKSVIKIYYAFNTPFGRIPSNLKYGKKLEFAQTRKLPYAEIKF